MSLHHDSPHMRHFMKHKEMNELYLSYGILNFAIGLISIFIPIYLYKLDYSIPAILFFFFLNSIGFVLFSYWGAQIVARLGVKHTMLLTIPIFIIFFIGLKFIPQFPFLFFILPLLRSFKMILYNYSFHLNFIQHSDRKHRGREVSIIQALEVTAGILSPLIGGAIIKYSSFSVLFFVGSVILFFSMIPLFRTQDTYEAITFEKKRLIRDVFKKENLNYMYSFSGYAIESWIGMILWPIFLFVMLFNVESIGALTSVTTLVTFVMFYFIGKATDKKDKRELLRLGVLLYFFGWIGRIFVTGFTSMFFIDTYKNLTQRVVAVPWTAYSYDLAAKGDYFKFIVQREIVFNISRSLMMPILMLIFFLAGNTYAFIISFTIAAFFSLFYVALNKETA
ncbi:MAG: MFS transporter [Parcubacteria group bacterium]